MVERKFKHIIKTNITSKATLLHHKKVPIYSTTHSSSNYVWLLSFFLCWWQRWCSRKAENVYKNFQQKIYDFSHNNIFMARSDMEELWIKMWPALEVYHFSWSLSRLLGVARSKTNSEICQLFNRLIQLKIYIFLLTRMVSSFFSRVSRFDHRKGRNATKKEKKTFHQKKRMNIAANNNNSFEESERDTTTKTTTKKTSNNWVIFHCGCKKKIHYCLLVL